LQLGTRISKS